MTVAKRINLVVTPASQPYCPPEGSRWDTETKVLKRMFTGQDKDILSETSSPNGPFIVAASSDQTVRIRDVDSGLPVRRCVGHHDTVTAVGHGFITVYAFLHRHAANKYDDSQESRIAVTINLNDTAAGVWDTATGRPQRSFALKSGLVLMSSDGKFVVDFEHDSGFCVFDTNTGDCVFITDDLPWINWRFGFSQGALLSISSDNEFMAHCTRDGVSKFTNSAPSHFNSRSALNPRKARIGTLKACIVTVVSASFLMKDTGVEEFRVGYPCVGLAAVSFDGHRVALLTADQKESQVDIANDKFTSFEQLAFSPYGSVLAFRVWAFETSNGAGIQDLEDRSTREPVYMAQASGRELLFSETSPCVPNEGHASAEH
ncbi:hypothetical protein BBP40_009952 [Aspergillus hancockii]|nr:hypothetical protein BBP40_009952 [Aspergillus hancockii]